MGNLTTLAVLSVVLELNLLICQADVLRRNSRGSPARTVAGNEAVTHGDDKIHIGIRSASGFASLKGYRRDRLAVVEVLKNLVA